MNMMEIEKIARLKDCLINKGIYSEELWEEIITIFFETEINAINDGKKIQFVIKGI